MIQSNSFELSETSPTRVTISSMSCIDHIIQQNCISPQVFVLEYQSFSDHYPLTIKWKITQKCSKVNAFRATSFLKSPAKVKQYKVSLNEHLRSFRIYIVDADEAFNNFNRLFMEITDEFAPFRTFQSKVEKPKWISNEPKNLRTSKNLTHCKWKKTRKNVHLEKFKLLRYKFENLVRINKKR